MIKNQVQYENETRKVVLWGLNLCSTGKPQETPFYEFVNQISSNACGLIYLIKNLSEFPGRHPNDPFYQNQASLCRI